MRIPPENTGVMLALERLLEIFEVPELPKDTEFGVQADDGRAWDAVSPIGGHVFAIEWRRSGSVGFVAGATHQLKIFPSRFSHEVIPLLAVPHMGEAAKEHCVLAQINWLDLSGNARIIAPGIFYQNLGNPNRFRRSGRPESAFGPRGSRITRRLLMKPDKPAMQRTLASSTGLNEGHTSRIVGKLLETRLVERGEDGIRVVDAGALLDAWQEDYRFDRHHIIRGHIPARGGVALIHSIAEAFSKMEESYAATALPAAWLWTQYARFRLSTVYIPKPPSAGQKKALRFREEAEGSNTWLVVPNDEGVFHGAELVDGVRCVHPAQAYVDLKNHPERASEAAAGLRRWLGLGGKDGV